MDLSPHFCATQGPWGSSRSGLVYNWWLFSASLLSPPWRLISGAKCPLVRGHTHLFNRRHPLASSSLSWALYALSVDLHRSQKPCAVWMGPHQQIRAYQTACHKTHIEDTQFRSFRFIAIKSTMSANVEILLGPWGPGKWWRGAEFGRKIENL